MGGKLRTENHPKVILGIREHSLCLSEELFKHDFTGLVPVPQN